MKIFGPIVLAMLMAISLASQAYSQGNLAPLYTFTNGDGSITPYQSGQQLEVGQIYTITAVPDAGYQFSSWQPVNVFIITQTNYNNIGDPILPPVESIIPSVVPTNIYGAELEFTMQDIMDVTSDGDNPDIIRTFGWQANFEPVPEPAEAAMVGSGFAAMTLVVMRRRQWRSRILNSQFGGR